MVLCLKQRLNLSEKILGGVQMLWCASRCLVRTEVCFLPAARMLAAGSLELRPSLQLPLAREGNLPQQRLGRSLHPTPGHCGDTKTWPVASRQDTSEGPRNSSSSSPGTGSGLCVLHSYVSVPSLSLPGPASFPPALPGIVLENTPQQTFCKQISNSGCFRGNLNYGRMILRGLQN